MGQVPPDPLLRPAVAARDVDERDAELEDLAEQSFRLALGELIAPDVPGAEAEHRDPQPARPEIARLHRSSNPTRRSRRRGGDPDAARPISVVLHQAFD